MTTTTDRLSTTANRPTKASLPATHSTLTPTNPIARAHLSHSSVPFIQHALNPHPSTCRRCREPGVCPAQKRSTRPPIGSPHTGPSFYLFSLFTTHAICCSPNLPPQPLALCARFPLVDALSKAHQARSHSPTACIPLYQRSQQGLLCWPPSGSSARKFGGRPHVRRALATYHLHPTFEFWSSEDEDNDDNFVTLI